MSFHQALRPARLRTIVVAVVLAVTGLLVSTSQIASAHEVAAVGTGGAKPVIVLEHGAWADGSSWDQVVRILQGDGYIVYVPPNPLRGVAADSAYLNDFLTRNANLAGKPVVLVGHSYGGFVITNAAVGDSEVKALVYVDAFLPKQGDTLKSLTTSGSCLAADPTKVFDFVPYPGGPAGDVDLYVKQSLFPGCFANGLPASEASALAATQRPLAASALDEQSGAPAWATLPSWDVIGTNDHIIPEAAQLAMAQRAHAHITEVDAPHLSMISSPEAVTRVIEQAARAAS
ncbi:MAG TPA: alpha/beta hydrolase [Streptosporangiaceae bacterium]|nr:alpha/beta hydrolase [Streptosporangiaceae bacterium]